MSGLFLVPAPESITEEAASSDNILTSVQWEHLQLSTKTSNILRVLFVVFLSTSRKILNGTVHRTGVDHF